MAVELLSGIGYLIAAVFFILGIKFLGKVKTASKGNLFAAIGMFIGVIVTLYDMYSGSAAIQWMYLLVGVIAGGIIGLVLAKTIKMTAMPQLVAVFNGFGGGASVLVALSYVMIATNIGGLDIFTVALSCIIGSVTFTGSFIAFGKLQGLVSTKPVLFPGRHILNLVLFIGVVVLAIESVVPGIWFFGDVTALIIMCIIALVLGVLLVTPIGGADMPVVIALLNSYSGLAAAMAGFVLGNLLLIIGGALVGASGLILTQIMCKAMNRSLVNVLFGGFGESGSSEKDTSEYKNVKSTSSEEAALLLDGVSSVIIVPGYGMAVAQAQNAVRDLTHTLESKHVQVNFAIHPVAGRMPGHMNVLLAEADIPYESLHDLESINDSFKETDVVIVLGANDVVNPAAAEDKSSPIYGMPILNVHEAKTVVVVKRSLSPGFAGIKNKLFEADNTMMLFGDAKQAISDINKELKEL